MKRLIFLILLIPFICFGNGINKGKYTPPDTILKYADKVFTVGGTYLRYIPKATSFVPTDIAGCQLWLDAGQGITKDGSDYVSVWADQSGNGNDATQGTGSAQPLYVANQLNGEPVIRFDGSTDFMNFSQINTGDKITVFIVFKRINTSGWGIPISNGAGNGFIGMLTNVLYFEGDFSSYAPWAYADNTNYHIYTLKDDASSAYAREDGADIGTPQAYSISSFKYQQLGGWSQYSILSPIDMSEIIIYDSALDDTNRGLVEDYLNAKYSIY